MLTGGTTNVHGIMEHVTNVLTALAPSTMRSRREFGRDVKEKLCYIALVYDTELKSTTESFDKKQTHMLSDGNIFTVSAERGTTMFQEIGERMTKNPTELPPPSMKTKVVAPPERKPSGAIGGSILLF